MKKIRDVLHKDQIESISKAGKLRERALERAYKGTASRSGAIKAKCCECVGFEDVSNQVGNCAVYRCPLHAYRPFQKS